MSISHTWGKQDLHVSACWSYNSFTFLVQYITVHCPRSFPVHEDNKTYMSMLAGVRGILSITPRGHASHFFSMTKGIQDGHWICAVRVSVLKQNVHCIHVFIVEKIILT